MNRSDFVNMIGSKGQVNRSMLGEVYELIDLFPYFQSAHLLLLKGLKDNEDIKFEKQLRSSAVHIADREVLYYLLKSESQEEIALEKNSTDIIPIIIPDSIETSEPADTEQTVIETAKNSDLLISEFERDTDTLIDQEPEDGKERVASHSVLLQGNKEDYDDRVILIMDENNQGEEEKVFFMDPGFSIPEKEELLELDTEVNGISSFDNKIENINYESVKQVSKKHLQSELIDKFIINNPRIEPAREKSNLPVEDLSKPHVEEKESFVTETLARIYVTQGYYSKAIEIYEKLSLKFPEKSTYFAAQIEKVKEYINK